MRVSIASFLYRAVCVFSEIDARSSCFQMRLPLVCCMRLLYFSWLYRIMFMFSWQLFLSSPEEARASIACEKMGPMHPLFECACALQRIATVSGMRERYNSLAILGLTTALRYRVSMLQHVYKCQLSSDKTAPFRSHVFRP